MGVRRLGGFGPNGLAGNPNASAAIAMHHTGTAIPRNDEEAARWLYLAATQGIATRICSSGIAIIADWASGETTKQPPIGFTIEQGAILECEGVPIGVVEGIVSIDRYEVTVTGLANHAGTTPMAERQDALLAASHLTIAVRDIVTSEPDRQVGTVGRLEVTPNSPNVVSGVCPGFWRPSRSAT